MFLASALPTDLLAGPFVLRTRKGGFSVATAREVEQLLGTNTEDSVTVFDRGTGKTLTRKEFLALMPAQNTSAPPASVAAPTQPPIICTNNTVSQPEHDALASPPSPEPASTQNRRRTSDRSASVRMRRGAGKRPTSWGFIGLGIVAVGALGGLLLSRQAPHPSPVPPTPAVIHTPVAQPAVPKTPPPTAAPVQAPPPVATPAGAKKPTTSSPASAATIPAFPTTDAEIILADLPPDKWSKDNGGDLALAENGGWDLTFAKQWTLLGGTPERRDLRNSAGIELRLFTTAKKSWELVVSITEGSHERQKITCKVQPGKWNTLRIPWTDFERNKRQYRPAPDDGLQIDAVQMIEFLRADAAPKGPLHLRVAPIGVYR